ncbi:hypothetical protein HYV69_02345 [Candidatus Uhrbacteria bacterium]|nr:hypothetical protein [Candidatus Uhrbacteria bacterium]
MTNSIAQRALTVAVVAATILWSVGFAALVPQQASAAAYGDLIKGSTLSTVYYYGSDGQRYSFPNLKTFNTWYVDFSGLVTLSDSELAAIPLGGNIVYRPGSRWIKITSDNKTYAVAKNGSVRWIESEEVAKGLAGSDWNQNIDDVPDVFFVDYTVGDSLTSAASAYEGALVKIGSDNYLVWGGKKLKVSSAGFTANNFKSGFVLDGSGATLSGLSAGDEVTAKLAYLTDAAQKVTTSEVVSSKDVSVSFAGSPSASTLIAGQGIADLAHLKLTNNSASEVKLNKVTLARLGVSSDTTLSNLYLFDGFVRLTDVATISDGKVTFNDASGLFAIAPGASKEVVVRSDIAASTNGQTVGLKLASASDLTFSNGGAASGSFPLVGATHTIASQPSTFGTADFSGSTTPTANTSVDPAEGIKLFERTLSVGTNELSLKAVRVRNIGSIDAVDVNNWQLYVGGVKRGSSVASEDSLGYVTFDLSAAPIELKTGNHQVKVMADVIGGSGRTVQVGLRNSADFVAVDSDYGQPVLSTVGSSTFSAMDAGLQTMASGSLTFTKTTDSPTGNIVETSSGVTLGKWTIKAFGEKMKVENLRFAFTESDGNDVTLRNGAVYLNGVQIGSTTGLEANAGAGTDYTSYSFGSSFIVSPGVPASLEIRSDIFDSDGTDNIEDADTIRAEISDMNNVLNVQRMTSGSYIDAPDGAAVIANTLTVAAAALTVAKNGSYANQTTIDPKTAYKIGSYTVTAGTSEGINLTDFNIDFDQTDTATSDTSEPAAGDMYNLYLKYGPASNMVMTSIKGSISETSNTWSINYELKAGETIYVEAYADIDSAISTGEVIQTAFDANGTSVKSGTSPSTSKQAGQTVTITAGTFTEFNDDHPVAAIVYGNQEVTAAKYRFSASNESYTIEEMTTSVASATASGLVGEVRLYDGSTLKASTVYDESSLTRATWTGLSIPVAANATKILTVKYLLNSVGVGAGTSQTDVANTLYSVKFADSNGVETTETSGSEFSSVNGNSQYVFASIPTLSAVDLTNSTLVNGQAQDMYKFTLTASGGSVALKQFKLTTAWSDGGTGDTLEVESLKIYKNGSDITSSTTIVDELGNVVSDTTGIVDATPSTRVIVTWTTEDTISQGETVTYTVRGTPTGFRTVGADTVGDSVSFYLAQDAATNGTSVYINDETDQGAGQSEIMELFTSAAANTSDGTAAELIWSDISAASHASAANASSTGDWHNGFLVKNLDLAGETWSK